MKQNIDKYQELDNRLNKQMMQIKSLGMLNGQQNQNQIDYVEIESRINLYEGQINEFRQEQLQSIGQFMEEDINKNMMEIVENYKIQI